MAAVRVRILLDRDDKEVTVTIDLDEAKKALDGQTGKACVVIERAIGLHPLHASPTLERAA